MESQATSAPRWAVASRLARIVTNPHARRARLLRAAILVAGVLVTQATLYGPSLVGRKILLPLDLLATPGWYLPPVPPWDSIEPFNPILSDEILAFEFRRRFAAREIRSGRLPLWNPYNYCGAPFLAANNTAVFSVFSVPHYLFPGPQTIAWVQVLKSLVAAWGTYWFCRYGLGVGFWPAMIGAWCFPLIGFLVLFRGYPPSFVVVWLPWLLLTVAATCRRPSGRSGVALAVVTLLTLVSGHLAVAGLVLLASGFYFVWCWGQIARSHGILSRASMAAVLSTVGGWLLGMLLSAPQSVPTIEYLRYSHRVAQRYEKGAVGDEAIQPGIGVLPQFVLPYFYGSAQRGSLWIAPGNSRNRLEGAASGYAGLLAALVLAPLGWHMGRRGEWTFWAVAGLFAASYTLRVPVVQQVFDWLPLRLLNNNRFVFFTGWCVLTLAVLGLDAVVRGRIERRVAWAVATGILAVLGFWCAYRVFMLPPDIARLAAKADLDPAPIERWFRFRYFEGALLALIGLVYWMLAWRRSFAALAWQAVLPVLLVGEGLWMAYGVSPQCDPKLYYPPLPVLQRLQPSGERICVARGLPACLNQSHDLYDIRGYDGVDPVHLVELLDICRRQFPREPWLRVPYAPLQFFLPVDSPILDMLNVRHRLVPVQAIRKGPVRREDGFLVLENRKALPRVFVPRSVEHLADPAQVLAQLARRDFDARQVAYVNQSLRKSTIRPMVGQAFVEKMLPTEVKIRAEMQTPGLVVLSDLWFPGWNAYVDGRPVPVLRTNHALRGVEVPAGRHEVVFRYEPMSFYLGLAIGGAAVVVGLLWWFFGGGGQTFSELSPSVEPSPAATTGDTHAEQSSSTPRTPATARKSTARRHRSRRSGR